MFLITLLVFILILSVLVMIHEFGHFITAIKSGVAVEEFGFGIPPRVWGKKIKGVIYSLNALPFGGFVKVKGEDLDDKVDPSDKTNFANKSKKVRFLILFAGIFMNIILGAFLFFVVLAFHNFKSSPVILFNDNFKFPLGTQKNVETVVTYIEQGSPAEEASIKVGDIVESIYSGDLLVKIDTVNILQETISKAQDSSISVTLGNIKDNTTRNVTVTPKYNEELKRATIGIGLGSISYISYNSNVFEKLFSGFFHGINLSYYSLETFKDLIKVSVEEKNVEPVAQSVSGPVGIFSVVKQVLDIGGKESLFAILDLTALLSFSLAFINLLPLPALDGGRIFFVAVEAVTRRRPNPKIEALVHKVGMLVLLSLMLLVSLKDIINLK